MAYVNYDTLSGWRNQIAQGRSRKSNIDKELIDAKKRLKNTTEASVLEAASIQTDRRISDAQKKLQDEYADLNESIRLEIGRQNERYRRELDELRREIKETNLTYDSVKRRITEVNQKLDSALNKIKQAETQRKVRANTYADQLENLILQINEKHPAEFELLYPDRLAPGLHAVEDALSKVRSSVSNGDCEPAIGVAQTFISYAIGYQSQLDQLNEEFQAALSETEAALDQLQQTRDSAQRSILEMQVQINENQFSNDYDIYFWSAGIFSEIEGRIAEAVSLMNLGVETFDVSVMKDAKEFFQSISRQIEECRLIAERQFYLSCLCQETAYMMELVICRDGYAHWREVSSSFLDSDLGDRGTYQVILDNEYEAFVCILVSPDRECNTVICDIEVFDRDNNSVRRDTVRNGILGELRQDKRTSCLEVQKTPYNERQQDDLMSRTIDESERALDSWRDSAHKKILAIK